MAEGEIGEGPTSALSPAPGAGFCPWMETVAAATASAADKGLPHCLSPGAASGADRELPRGSSVLYDLAWPQSPPSRVSSVGSSGARACCYVQVQQFERQRLKIILKRRLGWNAPLTSREPEMSLYESHKCGLRMGSRLGALDELPLAGGDNSGARPGPGTSCFEREGAHLGSTSTKMGTIQRR